MWEDGHKHDYGQQCNAWKPRPREIWTAKWLPRSIVSDKGTVMANIFSMIVSDKRVTNVLSHAICQHPDPPISETFIHLTQFIKDSLTHVMNVLTLRKLSHCERSHVMKALTLWTLSRYGHTSINRVPTWKSSVWDYVFRTGWFAQSAQKHNNRQMEAQRNGTSKQASSIKDGACSKNWWGAAFGDSKTKVIVIPNHYSKWF